jgi:hypothetical protein
MFFRSFTIFLLDLQVVSRLEDVLDICPAPVQDPLDLRGYTLILFLGSTMYASHRLSHPLLASPTPPDDTLGTPSFITTSRSHHPHPPRSFRLRTHLHTTFFWIRTSLCGFVSRSHTNHPLVLCSCTSRNRPTISLCARSATVSLQKGSWGVY